MAGHGQERESRSGCRNIRQGRARQHHGGCTSNPRPDLTPASAEAPHAQPPPKYRPRKNPANNPDR
ncbi:IgG-binding virulence factor TspB family protein [Neisseria gonorrhoeae]|uniref:IgG-binding virulence factor TspB family protein n=1 Tax=Neisseria gonorrhoeae TaxID=485 RepID=UPI00387B7500